MTACFVVCCHLDQDSVPYNIFGYGCHEHIGKAVEKAFLEAWRFYWEFGKIKNKRKEAGKEIKTFIDHFNAYAFNRDADTCFFPEKKIKLGRIVNTGNNEIKIDGIDIIALKNYGIPGYSIRVARDDVWQLQPGRLKEDRERRKCGDIHPIA